MVGKNWGSTETLVPGEVYCIEVIVNCIVLTELVKKRKQKRPGPDEKEVETPEMLWPVFQLDPVIELVAQA